MDGSRTQLVLKNTAFGIVSKLSGALLGFISRTVFIYILGNTYLGINGLYSEILSVLSFAELGFGGAMTYAMYKPVAHHDIEQVEKLLIFYKKVYRIVAAVIAAVGLCLLPLLPHIVKGAESLSLQELQLYYCIFLFNTVTSYFVTYKYSYLTAQQKGYVITRIDVVINSFTILIQIVIIIRYQSFIAYLLTQSVMAIISKLIVCIYLNKRYPVLRAQGKGRLSKHERTDIYREVRGLAVHQFSSVAVHSTDNIIISSLSGLGVVAVGFIGNYNMLMNIALGFVSILFGSMAAGFGNLVASSTVENYRNVFQQLNFLNFWIYGFCSIAFFVLIPPFITLWIGPERLIDTTSFLLILLNCYLQGQSTIYNNARIAKGSFGRDKWWALVQAVVNLVVSVIGARMLGLVGVYIGTVVSRLVHVLFRPHSTYRFLFERSSAEYYAQWLVYLLATIVAGTITVFVTGFILTEVTVIRFLVAAILVAVLPNGLFLLAFYRTEVFKNVCTKAKQILRRGGQSK